MKKFTLLLVAFLAMSGMAFGQVLPKVLWESTVDKGDWALHSGSPIIFKKNKNILVSYGYAVDSSGKYKSGYGKKGFDKNGKIIWDSDDFYKENKGHEHGFIWHEKSQLRLFPDARMYERRIKDSISILNENFKVVRSFDLFNPNTFLHTVENGIFYSNSERFLIKYDETGKEEWRYKSSADTTLILNKSAPYFCLIGGDYRKKRQIVILDKNGKVKGMTEPNTYGNIFPTNDKGFWIQNSFLEEGEYIKYDSVGKETGRFKINVLQTNSPHQNSSGEKSILNDNSLLLTYLNKNNELVILNIATNGSPKIIVRDLGLQNMKSILNAEKYLSVIRAYKLTDDGFVMYGISSEFEEIENNKIIKRTYQTVIGVEKLSDTKYGWNKEVQRNNDLGDAAISMSVDNIFQIRRAWNLQYYTIEGNLKWSYRDWSYLRTNRVEEIMRIGDVLYVSYDVGLYILDAADGKVLWKNEELRITNTLRGQLRTDNLGITYLLYTNCQYYPCASETIKVQAFQKNGSPLWSYTYPQIIRGNSLFYAEAGDGAFFSLTLEPQINSNEKKYILRKISPCNDLNGISITANNTEVCSGTKVKLSTTKQDGLTYQWQKDGKDIPTFKDIVHDVDESGNYTVTVKDEICQNQTISNPIKVTIKPNPEAKISTDIKGVIYEPFTVKMTANSGTGLAYQWLKDDAIIPNETTANYEAKKSGKYNVSVTQDGCVKVSDALNISILIPLVNESEIGEDVVQVYPNPNKGEFKIILPKSLKSANIQLFDSFGRERNLIYTGEQAQADGLVQGVYFLRVIKGEKNVTNKIVVE
jgi:hypothetical protein